MSIADVVSFTQYAGFEIDRTFRAAMMAVGRSGGPGLRERHGPGCGVVLIEFRTSLAWPDGAVRAADFAEVKRYNDPRRVDEDVAAVIERGTIERGVDGRVRATGAGHAFLNDLYETQARELATLWAGHGDHVMSLARVLGDLVRAASPLAASPGAFAAMEPAYEPDGIGDAVLTLNRLSAMRYFRSDAHARAWRAAGLTAAEMTAPRETGGHARDQIERRTNERASPAFAALSDEQRRRLMAGLKALPTG